MQRLRSGVALGLALSSVFLQKGIGFLMTWTTRTGRATLQVENFGNERIVPMHARMITLLVFHLLIVCMQSLTCIEFLLWNFLLVVIRRLAG